MKRSLSGAEILAAVQGGKSLAEVGREQGVSRERIRQIVQREMARVERQARPAERAAGTDFGVECIPEQEYIAESLLRAALVSGELPPGFGEPWRETLVQLARRAERIGDRSLIRHLVSESDGWWSRTGPMREILE